MEKKIEKLENFKKAITSTVKSIIGEQSISVTFGKEVAKENIKIINLPNIQSIDLTKLLMAVTKGANKITKKLTG